MSLGLEYETDKYDDVLQTMTRVSNEYFKLKHKHRLLKKRLRECEQERDQLKSQQIIAPPSPKRTKDDPIVNSPVVCAFRNKLA
jgi:hypothetical protein